MGYELKIMVGRKSKGHYGIAKTRFDVLATVDLCQSNAKSKIRKLARHSKVITGEFMWFGDRFNNRNSVDEYGDYFVPVPVETVLDALIADFSKYGYKRFEWAIGLLSKMVNDNMAVIFYGH